MMTKTTLCAGLLFLFPLVCSAAGTVELRVTGRILPDACTPTFSNHGVVKYEAQPATGQPQGALTVLDKKTLTLSLSCVHSTRLTMKLVDNRIQRTPSYQVPVAGAIAPNQYQFGMKTTTGEPAGGYIISLEQRGQDGMPILESATDGDAMRWTTAEHNALRKDVSYTWGAHNRNMPGRVLQTQTTLSIQPVIGGSEIAPRSSDGSATVELTYL